MNIANVILLLVILTLIIKWFMCEDTESFLGSITQLQARGPQDLHLTVNTEKYVYPHRYRGYTPPCNRVPCYRYPTDQYVWNIPTRYNIPYLYPDYDYDYNFRLFPFYYRWWY